MSRRYIAVVLSLIVMLCNAAFADELRLSPQERKWVAEHGVITVLGETDWAPFDFFDDNVYQGLARSYLDVIAMRTGLRFRYEVGLWADNVKRFEAGEADILAALYYSDERAKRMRFSDQYYQPLDYFFGSESLFHEDIRTVQGARVAMTKGYITIDYVKSNFPNLTVVEYDSVGHAIDAVVNGEAELLYDTYSVVNFWLRKDGIQSIKPLVSSRGYNDGSLRFAIHSDLPLLQRIINKALASISTEERLRIEQQWLLNEGDFMKGEKLGLSEFERQWLAENRVFSFGGDPGWLPFEGFDDDGNYIGIVADHLAIFEQLLAAEFQPRQTQTWLETVRLAKAGELDIISETIDSDLGKHLLFTDPYVFTPIVIVMGEDAEFVASVPRLQHQRVAVVQEYGYVGTLKNAYPDIDFIEVATLAEGLAAVSRGELGALFATLTQSSYQMRLLGFSNLKIVGHTGHQVGLAFGVNPRHEPLVGILNKAIKAIPLRERDAILDRWASNDQRVGFDYYFIGQLAIAFVVVALVLLFWNRRLAAEVKQRQSAEAQTNALLDNIPVQVAVCDVNGRLLTANAQFLMNYKLAPDELHHMSADDLYSDDRQRLAVLEILKRGGEIRNEIIPSRFRSDREQVKLVSIIPIDYQNQTAFLSIGLDISERIEMEEALKVAKLQAETANKSKSDFLANMSHEIRTPMNAIIGFSELLFEKIEDRKLKAYVRTISDASNNLLKLIDDILDLSKVEAGKVEIDKSPSNPHVLFEEMKHIFSIEMINKGIALHLDVDSAIPESLMLDLSRLRQVLLNLIGNAIKFTDDGYIKLIARVEGDTSIGSKVQLAIEVEDTGIGIAPEQIATIFTDFGQVASLDRAKYGGTGLGLAISQRLVSLMGGELTVTSEVGTGSVFSVHLHDVDVATLAAESEPAEESLQVLQFEPATILVVDDLADNRFLVKEIFIQQPIRIIEASDGIEAIEQLRHYDIDLILLDLRMPNMDGYECASIVKQHHDIPIIALTASVMQSELKRLQYQHFDGYIRKPVKRTAVLSYLAQFLATRVDDKDISGALIDVAIDESLLQKAHDEGLVSQLQALIPQANKCIESNDMAEVERFLALVKPLAKNYPLPPLLTYVDTLEVSIDTFDIVAIEAGIAEFERLCQTLSRIIH